MQHLPPSRESIHIYIKKWSSHTQSHKKSNDKKNENDMNIVHILKLSDIENEKAIKQQELKDNVSEIQMNNGKSLLFSSRFSYDKNDKNDNDNDEIININQIDIDNIINTMHSSIDSSDKNDNTETMDKIISPKVGVIKETQSNPTYNTEREYGNTKEGAGSNME